MNVYLTRLTFFLGRKGRQTTGDDDQNLTLPAPNQAIVTVVLSDQTYHQPGDKNAVKPTKTSRSVAVQLMFVKVAKMPSTTPLPDRLDLLPLL